MYAALSSTNEFCKQTPIILILCVALLLGITLPVLFWFSDSKYYIIGYIISVSVSLLFIMSLIMLIAYKISKYLYVRTVESRRQSCKDSNPTLHNQNIALISKICTLAVICTGFTVLCVIFTIIILFDSQNEWLWSIWQIMIMLNVLTDLICVSLSFPNSNERYEKRCRRIDGKFRALWNKILDEHYEKLSQTEV